MAEDGHSLNYDVIRFDFERNEQAEIEKSIKATFHHQRMAFTKTDAACTMVSAKASLPRLGLGMAALGRPGYINLNRSSILGVERDVDTMQTQANVVMDRLFSLSSGQKAWLDCARSYGLSEKFVGEYLRANNINPEDVYVSSKWGYSKYIGLVM